jgi:multidrug resistance efflux pump
VPPLPVPQDSDDADLRLALDTVEKIKAAETNGGLLGAVLLYRFEIRKRYKADAEAALASLQARLEAAERDAARYRWLRDMDMLDQPSVDLASAFRKYTGSALDSAIDRIAAIDAATSQEGK